MNLRPLLATFRPPPLVTVDATVPLTHHDHVVGLMSQRLVAAAAACAEARDLYERTHATLVDCERRRVETEARCATLRRRVIELEAAAGTVTPPVAGMCTALAECTGNRAIVERVSRVTTDVDTAQIVTRLLEAT